MKKSGFKIYLQELNFDKFLQIPCASDVDSTSFLTPIVGSPISRYTVCCRALNVIRQGQAAVHRKAARHTKNAASVKNVIQSCMLKGQKRLRRSSHCSGTFRGSSSSSSTCSTAHMGAPDCPAESSPGQLQNHSLQCSLVHGFGRLHCYPPPLGTARQQTVSVDPTL